MGVMLNAKVAAPPADVDAAITAVHQHCAVFTARSVAEVLLDLVGWRAEAVLVGQRLLEPSCGEGALLVPAARRLVHSATSIDRADFRHLADSLTAYEFVHSTSQVAREAIEAALVEAGLAPKVAMRLAVRWVRNEDFLVADLSDQFTHVAANPPYMRWSRVPRALRTQYEQSLPVFAARGDLSLAFIWRSVAATTKRRGCVGLLCADRWLRCAYGASARAEMGHLVSVAAHLDVHDAPVFAGSRKVSTYPAVTILTHRPDQRARVEAAADGEQLRARLRAGLRQDEPAYATSNTLSRDSAVLGSQELRALFDDHLHGLPRLKDVGVTVRCGTALGHAPAFVLGSNDAVEEERTLPFVRSRDLHEDGHAVRDVRVANVWDADGSLVDLARWPKLAAHLERHRERLIARACVSKPEQWYRTIDRINVDRVAQPKILVAGMAKASRVAFTSGGEVPSNALYAITSDQWPIRPLFELLRAGYLDVYSELLSPRFSGGTRRFDGNFLAQVRLPAWVTLDAEIQRALEAAASTSPDDRVDIICAVIGLPQRATKRVIRKCLYGAVED